jgi:hypothetical protein
MTRRASKFRQREITRTIKAARAAGVEVDRIEIDTDGKIVAHLGSGGDSPKKRNAADEVLERLDREQHAKK